TRWRNSQRIRHGAGALDFGGLEGPIAPQDGDGDVEEHFGRLCSYGPLAGHRALLVASGQRHGVTGAVSSGEAIGSVFVFHRELSRSGRRPTGFGERGLGEGARRDDEAEAKETWNDGVRRPC